MLTDNQLAAGWAQLPGSAHGQAELPASWHAADSVLCQA